MDADLALGAALEAHGLRRTPQRAAVYRFLRASVQHPTADEVFTAVRSEIPDISLATVYKALETLASCGLATRLAFGEEAARFDARTDQHFHARCLSCGNVSDVPGTAGPALLDIFASESGFQISAVHVEVVGRCVACTG